MINLTNAFDCIIKAFQNPIWAEQARNRLHQIKVLTTYNEKPLQLVSGQASKKQRG